MEDALAPPVLEHQFDGDEHSPGRAGWFETRLAAADSRIGELEEERTNLRDRVNHLIGTFSTFKANVRRIGIEQMKEGRWCAAGLNEKLEELGLEPYFPRYVVSMSVEVTMELYADDEEDAASMAKEDLKIESSDENYLDVGDIYVRSVEEDEDA